MVSGSRLCSTTVASSSSAATEQELDEAWAAEAAKVTVAAPPPGVRPSSATTVIDGITVTDAERRLKTREFLDTISDISKTSSQESRDMIYAAVRQNTLKPHHLERIIAHAAAINPHDRQVIRAMHCVMAALDAADEIQLPVEEYAANEHILNLLLYRVAGACNNVQKGLRPGHGPQELRDLVGDGFMHEPQWWLAARLEARGVPITIPMTLKFLELAASRQKTLFGVPGVLRANRAEFVERQRQYAAEEAGATAAAAAEEMPAAGRQRAAFREPNPMPANGSVE